MPGPSLVAKKVCRLGLEAIGCDIKNNTRGDSNTNSCPWPKRGPRQKLHALSFLPSLFILWTRSDAIKMHLKLKILQRREP